MDITTVDPSLRATALKVPAMNLDNPFMLAVAAIGSRLIPTTRVAGVAVRHERAGTVRLRVYTPERPDGSALLWIHGGGLVLGSPAMDDAHCGATASATGATIVSVDYRLAPRHPFPAAIDDVRAGFGWLADHIGELGVDPSRIAVGGQSAGGGLAACLVQRLHDEGVPLAAQWLFCPMLDDRTAADRTRDATDHFIWNNRSNLVGWTSYLGPQFATATLPPYAAAARREDLSGLPPAWLYASDIELFHDEVADYAGRLRAAGVEVTFEVVHGAPHGFEAWAADTKLARDLVASARTWLTERLA